MKMSNELYTKIRDPITKYVKDHPDRYQFYKKCLGDERCRWEIFWESVGDIHTDEEYRTLNNSHVDTALKRICKEINKQGRVN